MKTAASVVVLMVLVLVALSIAFAQEPGEMKEEMMGKAMMGAKLGMHPGLQMMKNMIGGQMVATKDGGVIVMMGKKLLKYDKDLNLKKEVEIKVDMEKMLGMMEQWKEKCQMRKEMMEEGGMDSASTEEASE